MKNFPRTINNKNDINNLLANYPVETKAYLQQLLDTTDVWLMTSKLADGDNGVTDDTHKVEEIKDDADVVAERYQYEFMEDPNCELYRLGFESKAEAEALAA